MYWDFDEESTVKSPKQESKKYEKEVMSVFGYTDTTKSVEDILNSSQHSHSGTATSENSPHSPTSPTFLEQQFKALHEHQAKLPQLPVPTLKETMDLYLNSLAGLVNAEEYDKTESYVEDFIKKGGEGEKLQEILEERAKDPKNGNPSWLEGFWDDGYLMTSDPIPININYFFGLENYPKEMQHCQNQLGRAASLLHAAVNLHCQIRDGELSMDYERGTPIDMSQYVRVFCASRVPGETRDHIITYTSSPITKDNRESKTSKYESVFVRHVVVMVRNRMFVVPVIDTKTNKPTSLETMLEKLAFVMVEARKFVGPPVGLFTTMDRREWYKVREQLLELDPTQHQKNFQYIQSAIIVLVLDTLEADSPAEAARIILHGSGTNRWFDRHNLIVTKNAWAGINFEHSVGDGATTLRIADALYNMDCVTAVSNEEASKVLAEAEKKSEEYHQQHKGETASSTTSLHKHPTDIIELHWKLDGTTDALMKLAYDDFLSLIASNETNALHFGHFGGDYIKKVGISPDAFVQLAFQVTYSKLFGRNDATYEAASTRGFLHGRTEVVRSVTRAAVDFCESMHHPIFSRKIKSKIPDQYALLKDAAAVHVEYMKKAKVGRGVDRHLLGLKMMSAMCRSKQQSPESLHPLFTDPNFAKSGSHWTVSTSHCGSRALSLFGFGPVVSDGFGLGYMIKNDSIEVVITSKYTHHMTSSSIFSTMLEASLLQMKVICESRIERSKVIPNVLEFAHPTSMRDFEYDPERGFIYKTGKAAVGGMYRRATSNFFTSMGSFEGSSTTTGNL